MHSMSASVRRDTLSRCFVDERFVVIPACALAHHTSTRRGSGNRCKLSKRSHSEKEHLCTRSESKLVKSTTGCLSQVTFLAVCTRR